MYLFMVNELYMLLDYALALNKLLDLFFIISLLSLSYFLGTVDHLFQLGVNSMCHEAMYLMVQQSLKT
jgi:hypothetical protein